MNYTAKEVMQYVQEENIKFIRLAFCDIFGRQKNIAIMPSELSRAFAHGIAIDASAIRGFGGEVRSDLFLRPDPSTLSYLPWRPESGGVVRMFCSISYPDGTPFHADSRQILKDAVAAAEARGVSFEFGAEMEFYLFQLDENGHTSKVPFDYAGYMDIAPEDKGENVRREICLTLEQMGIQPESSHHEEGPGQNEIDFRYSDPLSAADNAVTFHSVVQAIAARNGLAADFTPKPLPNETGNGLHINFSVRSKDGRDLLSQVIAGIMAHIQEMTVFLNSTENSYARLGGNKAPKYISWSHENRSQLIRVPATPNGASRAELRSADPMANPYLAFALLIYAGLDGIEKQLTLPEAADINLYAAPEDILCKFQKLPASLREATGIAKESAFVKQHLSESVITAYCG